MNTQGPEAAPTTYAERQIEAFRQGRWAKVYVTVTEKGDLVRRDGKVGIAVDQPATVRHWTVELTLEARPDLGADLEGTFEFGIDDFVIARRPSLDPTGEGADSEVEPSPETEETGAEAEAQRSTGRRWVLIPDSLRRRRRGRARVDIGTAQ